jgi:hypothetical protein
LARTVSEILVDAVLGEGGRLIWTGFFGPIFRYIDFQATPSPALANGIAALLLTMSKFARV